MHEGHRGDDLEEGGREENRGRKGDRERGRGREGESLRGFISLSPSLPFSSSSFLRRSALKV
jgi:hypothetical protein